MDTLLSAAGFDSDLTAELRASHGRQLLVLSVVGFFGCLLCALSLVVGSYIAVASVAVACAAGAVGFFTYWCSLVLTRAGGGFPAHAQIQDLKTWRPAPLAAVMFFVVGAMLTQPLVLLSMMPLIDGQLSAQASRHDAVVAGMASLNLKDDLPAGSSLPASVAQPDHSQPFFGLIARSRAAWDIPVIAGPLTLLFALLFALPVLWWVVAPASARAYAGRRWETERRQIDLAYEHTARDVERRLKRWPGFGGTLREHFVDPPYNSRPLLFGIEVATVQRVGRRPAALHVADASVEGAARKSGDAAGEQSATDDGHLDDRAQTADAVESYSSSSARSSKAGPEERRRVGEAAVATQESARRTTPRADPDDSGDEPDDRSARDEDSELFDDGSAFDDDEDVEDEDQAERGESGEDGAADEVAVRSQAARLPRAKTGSASTAGALALKHLDVGEARTSLVRKNLKRVAPFIALVTGRSQANVERTLNNRWRVWNKNGIHGGREIKNVFKEWNRLSTVMAVTPRFALAHGFVPIVAKRLRLSQDEVIARLEGAPPGVPLRELFATELAACAARNARRAR